jgi:hypothetical protein
MVMVLGALFASPSFTISWIVYEPDLSGVNVGVTLVGLTIAAVLPDGRAVTDHA